MTEDTMDVQTLLGKSADADFLREMIGFAGDRRDHAGEATPRRGARSVIMPRHGATWSQRHPRPLVETLSSTSMQRSTGVIGICAVTTIGSLT